MLHIAVQVKELVSSNLNAMVEAAGNPVKMLRLLQHELQEYVVALQGDRSRAERRRDRLADEAARHDSAAADWTAKARVAMDHKREDLARAALLTREQALADAARARGEAEQAGAAAREIAAAIGGLEDKLAETNLRLAEETARAQAGSTVAGGAPATRSERILDRVATLEKRVDFAAERRATPAPASVEAEIEQLEREARVSEELAAMKAAKTAKKPAAKAPARPKAKR